MKIHVFDGKLNVSFTYPSLLHDMGFSVIFFLFYVMIIAYFMLFTNCVETNAFRMWFLVDLPAVSLLRFFPVKING